MNHRKKTRCRVYFIATVCLAGLLTACGTTEPPTDFNAPPTERESMLLGVDATDEYFLTRFRRCVRWQPEYTCAQQPYGDNDGGGFD